MFSTSTCTSWSSVLASVSLQNASSALMKLSMPTALPGVGAGVGGDFAAALSPAAGGAGAAGACPPAPPTVGGGGGGGGGLVCADATDGAAGGVHVATAGSWAARAAGSQLVTKWCTNFRARYIAFTVATTSARAAYDRTRDKRR